MKVSMFYISILTIVTLVIVYLRMHNYCLRRRYYNGSLTYTGNSERTNEIIKYMFILKGTTYIFKTFDNYRFCHCCLLVTTDKGNSYMLSTDNWNRMDVHNNIRYLYDEKRKRIFAYIDGHKYILSRRYTPKNPTLTYSELINIFHGLNLKTKYELFRTDCIYLLQILLNKISDYKLDNDFDNKPLNITKTIKSMLFEYRYKGAKYEDDKKIFRAITVNDVNSMWNGSFCDNKLF